MRVLLVDDEERFVSVLAKRMRMRGLDADCAFTGEGALNLAAETRYDVVVLDVKMPGVGGIELKARLEQMSPDSKYIFVTGHGSPEDFSVGSSQASAYLSKPVDIDDLIAAIRECASAPARGEASGS